MSIRTAADGGAAAAADGGACDAAAAADGGAGDAAAAAGGGAGSDSDADDNNCSGGGGDGFAHMNNCNYTEQLLFLLKHFTFLYCIKWKSFCFYTSLLSVEN